MNTMFTKSWAEVKVFRLSMTTAAKGTDTEVSVDIDATWSGSSWAQVSTKLCTTDWEDLGLQAADFFSPWRRLSVLETR